MTIEVTSVPDRPRQLSLQRIVRIVSTLPRRIGRVISGVNRIVLWSIIAILTVAILLAADSLRRSYKYYASIVDARLASGYLTSRPGLYAAPTTLRPGQGLSPEQLVSKLRRAGYVEAQDSHVWSGTFTRHGRVVEIRPTPTNGSLESIPVRITFDDNQHLVSIAQDMLFLDSFTLEPEVLTNNVEMKVGEHPTLSYADIPRVLRDAILSIEDHRFFEHPGLDPFGVTRALLRNAVDKRIGQGGSTITQQLVKNTYLSAERTLRRKYAEAMLAFALERRLSKEDIFALYCNEVYLGQRGALAVRGVDQAAHVYFGKELKNLSLAEAATIAGMIQGPARYSPVSHPNMAQERRDIVLEAMIRGGSISRDEAVSASRESITLSAAPSEGSLAPYFIDCVNRSLESQLAVSGDEQRIYTTIDLDLQKLAEAALKRQLQRLDTVYKNSPTKPEAALVAMDPHTGNVLAMVGGRDYATSQLNRATDAHRQPGSTFKPFVYAAAIEDGMSPAQMFEDAPREFIYDRNRVYRPANFGGAYSMHDVTMRSGLVHSLNTVTVAVAMQTGLARIANLAERFGLPKPQRYPAMALGTSEVTPLELAAAYAVFVNGGRRIEPRVIAGLNEQPDSSLVTDPHSVQVIDPATAYVITNMLSAVVDHGTARAARGALKGSAIAAKTGTSRDGWFVGYTPNLVCAVWIGFDDNKQLGLTGAQAALPAWTDFMKSALALNPELGGRTFACPDGVKFVEIDSDTGFISTLTCPHRELIAIRESIGPNVECLLHGNLPRSTDQEHPFSANLPTTEAKQRARVFEPLDPTLFRGTRIEVDSTGKRTLVNEMR